MWTGHRPQGLSRGDADAPSERGEPRVVTKEGELGKGERPPHFGVADRGGAFPRGECPVLVFELCEDHRLGRRHAGRRRRERFRLRSAAHARVRVAELRRRFGGNSSRMRMASALPPVKRSARVNTRRIVQNGPSRCLERQRVPFVDIICLFQGGRVKRALVCGVGLRTDRAGRASSICITC